MHMDSSKAFLCVCVCVCVRACVRACARVNTVQLCMYTSESHDSVTFQTTHTIALHVHAVVIATPSEYVRISLSSFF